MPSLKDLRDRKKSVESTRKITSAMKMVAAAKLRRAQEQAEMARAYANELGLMLTRMTENPAVLEAAYPLLSGTGRHDKHLIIVMTADRGLCGGFNGSIVRELKARVAELQAQGASVALYAIGRKGREALAALMPDLLIASRTDVAKPRLTYETAVDLAHDVIARFDAHEFDVCHVIYSRFRSAMVQTATTQQIIPLSANALALERNESRTASTSSSVAGGGEGHYTFEPSAEDLLEALARKNVAVQMFRALLENAASEHGARMTAMDNATRNAGDMIRKLDLTYNRARQAYITKELIEIISGAEAI